MKKINDVGDKMFAQKFGDKDKKNSLFDESFFEDDDDDDDLDDDFDFDDDDDDDEVIPPSAKEPNLTPSASSLTPPIASPVMPSSVPKKLEQNPLSQSQVEPYAPKIASQAPSQTLDVQNNFAQDIQFRLGCELGQVLIPYENLQNLNIGSVVDFNNTVQTLYLSVNGVRVGEGMLVDIDGKIGVKITRWYGRL